MTELFSRIAHRRPKLLKSEQPRGPCEGGEKVTFLKDQRSTRDMRRARERGADIAKNVSQRGGGVDVESEKDGDIHGQVYRLSPRA